MSTFLSKISDIISHKKRPLLVKGLFVVDNSTEISNISLTRRDFEQTNYLIKKRLHFIKV